MDGEFIGVFLMENKKPVNWEKIGVYLAITAALMTVITYLFDIKDDISQLIKDDVGSLRERKVEVDHLKGK